MQKLLTSFYKNISIYAIFSDQSFNDTLTNSSVSFEQLGPGVQAAGGGIQFMLQCTEPFIITLPSYGYDLTLVMLNKLRCHAHF